MQTNQAYERKCVWAPNNYRRAIPFVRKHDNERK